MTPNRREFEKQCAFQKFCKSVLHNEACNVHEEIRRRRVREVTFSNLALHEERQLYTVDKYFQDEEAEPSYQMAGKEMILSILVYTFFSRMFDLMLPPVAKHSIVVA